MNFENVSRKHMNKLEFLVRELLTEMRKAKIQNDSLEESLRLFERELEEARRERFTQPIQDITSHNGGDDWQIDSRPTLTTTDNLLGEL
jgi:hypothetical protein